VSKQAGFAYRPALDGVRALAVAAVLLFHAGVAWLPGGFLGVDAFFVLSGYLITSLLLSERARRGRIRLGAFWLRRARRLLPALLVVLVVVGFAFRDVLPPVELGLLRFDALAALGYVANWRMVYRGADYFAQTAAPSPLQHTWSLGIEEQFYLLWPLIVVAVPALLLLSRRLVRHTNTVLLALCVSGVVASEAVAALLYRPDNVDRAYFGTDARAQALLVGCALAILLASPHSEAGSEASTASERTGLPDWAGDAVAVAGVGGIVVVGWLWTHAHGTDGWLYRGGLTVGAVAVAAVIAHAVQRPDAAVARVLAIAPLVWLGRISYGVYLWHWPLFALLTADRTGWHGPALLALRLAATLAVAAVSFVLIEEPIRRGRWPLGWQPTVRWRPEWPVRPTPWLRPAVVGVSAAAALGLTATSILYSTEPESAVDVSAPVITLPSVVPTPTASGSSQPVLPMQRAGRKVGTLPRVTFFGDSVSWSLGTYLPATPGLSVTVRSIQGCGIARLPDVMQLGLPHGNYPGCPTWDSRWRRGVNADDPDVAVILLDRWELMDRRLDGRYQHVGQPQYNAYLTGELELAISIAGSHGARVVLLTAPYTHRAERPDGGLYDEDQPARVDAWNRLLYQAAVRHAGTVSVIDLNRRVCPDGEFTWTIDRLRIRSDGLHFTPQGVQRWIAPWLLPQLATLALGGSLPSPTPTPLPSPSPTTSPSN
jgi:peptidoglycan/LPS O-acetylase OafA/YrhL